MSTKKKSKVQTDFLGLIQGTICFPSASFWYSFIKTSAVPTTPCDPTVRVAWAMAMTLTYLCGSHRRREQVCSQHAVVITGGLYSRAFGWKRSRFGSCGDSHTRRGIVCKAWIPPQTGEKAQINLRIRTVTQKIWIYVEYCSRFPRRATSDPCGNVVDVWDSRRYQNKAYRCASSFHAARDDFKRRPTWFI